MSAAPINAAAAVDAAGAGPSPSWLVLADDLSGAADCAIGFRAAGRRAVVALQPEASRPPGAAVLAVDLDSRRLPPAQAAALGLAAWRRHGGPDQRLYKKIDSTLRGNWAAETAALQPQAGMALVAPAFPATGRSTRQGRMLLNGEPLEQSDIWRLEQLLGTADLAALLQAQGLRCVRVEAASTEADIAALRRQLRALADDGVQAVACDAWEEAHLTGLARASLDLGRPVFWVGSGGLARVLAQWDGDGVESSQSSEALPAPPSPSTTWAPGPVLTLLGSLSGVSVRQAAVLAAQVPAMRRMEIAPALLRQGAGHAGWAGLQQQLGEALQSGQHLLLAIGRDAQVDPAEGPLLSTALARLVQPHFHRAGGLVATGGETARAMLEAVGIACLALDHEIEPGLPLSLTLEPTPRRVVTKAGAFGSEAALWRAWQAIAAPAPSPSLATS